MSGVLEHARAYVAAGLSVIPVRADGSKAPAESGWRAYSERRPTAEELDHWFGNGHAGGHGIGIPGGPASGNLAVLDFESWAAYERWMRSLSRAAADRTRKCPLAQTPSGGAHLYARLAEPVSGVVLATVPSPSRTLPSGRPAPETLIEIRGNGQQVVAPGSPAACHKTGKPYAWLRESWAGGGTCTTVPWEEWLEWLERAADQGTYTPPAEAPVAARPPHERGAGRGSPGDDFNRRGTWAETGLFDAGLVGAGWKWARQFAPDRGFVTRPGKGAGTSGTLGMVAAADGGHPLFFCFSTNGGPFAHLKSYSRWRVFGLLNHGGNWSAAARALARMGYGDPAGGDRRPVTTGSPGAPESDSAPGDARPPPPPPLPLIYYADVTPALDAADFVEGLLIDGGMSVVYGESGCGKTFFTLDLALHVAAGTPWRCREVDRRGVLYLALEGSHGIRNRVAAYKRATGRTALPLAVVPVTVNLLDPNGDTLRVVETARTAAAKLDTPVGLVVVDTLSRALAGGNENASDDMGALVRNIDLIRQALPAHVSIVHHSGKDAARGARGHSLLRAATDTEIEVSRDCGGGTSVARVTKQRELELTGEFPFRLEAVELGTNRRGKVVASCVVRDDSALPSLPHQTQRDRDRKAAEQQQHRADEEAVLAVVDAETRAGRPGASRSRIEDRAAGVPERRAGRALDRLLERGELVKVGPFDVPTHQGAGVTVREGFGRPKTANPLFE